MSTNERVCVCPKYVASGQTCSNGLAGYEASKVCCPVGCGQCGGSGCSALDGGGDACCTANVMAAGTLCSESKAAPCNIDTASVDPGDGVDSVDVDGKKSTFLLLYICDNEATLFTEYNGVWQPLVGGFRVSFRIRPQQLPYIHIFFCESSMVSDPPSQYCALPFLCDRPVAPRQTPRHALEISRVSTPTMWSGKSCNHAACRCWHRLSAQDPRSRPPPPRPSSAGLRGVAQEQGAECCRLCNLSS